MIIIERRPDGSIKSIKLDLDLGGGEVGLMPWIFLFCWLVGY